MKGINCFYNSVSDLFRYQASTGERLVMCLPEASLELGGREELTKLTSNTPSSSNQTTRTTISTHKTAHSNLDHS